MAFLLFERESGPDRQKEKERKSPVKAGLQKQITGIEPASSAWEADVLPMNYICMVITIPQLQKYFQY